MTVTSQPATPLNAQKLTTLITVVFVLIFIIAQKFPHIISEPNKLLKFSPTQLAYKLYHLQYNSHWLIAMHMQGKELCSVWSYHTPCVLAI